MKQYYFLLTLLLSTLTFAATGHTHLNDPVAKEEAKPVRPAVRMSRSFANLDAKIEKDLQQLAQKVEQREFQPNELYTRFDGDTTTVRLRNKAEKVINELVEGNKFLENLTEYLTGQTPVTLPIGIKKEVGNSQFIMGVSKIEIGTDYSELEIFVRLTLPQIDKNGKQRELFFGASRVKLSHKGGLFGDADLVLLGDVGIPFQGKEVLMILKGGFDLKSGNLDKKTYVTIDCNGFKELGLAVDVEFSRKKILPVKADNTIDHSTIPGTTLKKKVTTSFEMVATDWNDILIEVNLPRFQVPSLKNTIFELNTAIFDFSDTRNASNIQWPKGYQEKYLLSGEENLWRGVYVESLTVVLPKQFQKKGSTQRISFGAEKMLIDANGVSGTFKGENILPINEGSAAGWQFSVDRFQVTFMAGNLTAAGFGGAIVLPVTTETVSGVHTETYIDTDGREQIRLKKQGDQSKGSQVIAYNALIDPVNEEYVLNASPGKNMAFDVFKAKATITANSVIELRVSDGVFRPKAILHGNMAIKGSNSGSSTKTATADFEGITFQGLQLQTVSPMIQIGHAGYSGEVKIVNFPVTISEIGIRASDRMAALDFKVDINLMDSAGFSGATSLSIEGELPQGGDFSKWQFKRVKLKRIELAADIGFKIDGYVDFREDDPVYGDGFAGQVTAEFSGGIAVKINAAFGKKEFRYWYVDGLVSGLDIPVPTGISITGFGGGASYRMKKEGFSSTISSGGSGAKYIPDENSGLAVKAMMLFTVTGGSSVANGGFGFEMAFNTSGGINRVSLYGEAHMMQLPDFANPLEEISGNLKGIVENESKMSPAVQNQLKQNDLIGASKAIYPATMQGQKGMNAYVAIEFDFTTNTFHGTFELYIDVLGGVFKGVGDGGRAGWAVVHFSLSEWYIHVGTPTDPIGLKMGVGNLAIKSESYFMLGDAMPGSPPPPSEVANILGLDAAALDYMRDENALKGGRGIAFGSRFSFDTGDMTFLIFYASFQAGFGFDIMIKDYGETVCRGSGQIGVNGWYANGQAYVYLQGEMGINIKFMGIRKKIPIVKAGAAALLQAKLPNPTWLRGYLGGYYNLLGGAIKGRFRFELQFGEECDIISGGSPVGGMKIIADVKPAANASAVDVFAVPQVAFNMQVEQPIELEDDSGKLRKYRFKLDKFYLKDETGQQIPGEQSWNSTKDLLSFTSNEVLPPQKNLQLYVSVTFEEQINGTWTAIKENGKVVKEEENRTFTTGTAPDYIPMNNIAYCYPVVGQKYFFPKEHTNAYVKLKRGQGYLFTTEAGWSQKSYFTDDFGNAVESAISYNSGAQKVMIPIPSIANSKAYTLTLLTLPPEAVSGGTSESYIKKDLGDGESTIETKTVSIDALTTNPETIEMLTYEFRTSAHNTFREKINSKSVQQGIIEIIYADVHALQSQVRNSEPFEILDLSGGEYTSNKPLVQAEAILNDTYYKNEIYPLIYQNYPLNNKFTLDRDVSILGFPPTKAVEKMSWYETYLEYYPSNLLLHTRLAYRYNLPEAYKDDFIQLQYKITDDYLKYPEQYEGRIQQFDYIINGIFPYIKPGNYQAKLTYVLPGGNMGSQSDVIYINPN